MFGDPRRGATGFARLETFECTTAATSGREIGSGTITDYESEAIKCRNEEDLQKRTLVSSKMQVCKVCQKWIREMQSMIQRYDKTGSVKGTRAFEEFLKFKSCGGDGQDTALVTSER